MNDVLHNGLVALLEEAEPLLRTQADRHKMCMVYGSSLYEFTRYRPRPTFEPAKSEWAKEAYKHAAEKARNYITRHKQ